MARLPQNAALNYEFSDLLAEPVAAHVELAAGVLDVDLIARSQFPGISFVKPVSLLALWRNEIAARPLALSNGGLEAVVSRVRSVLQEAAKSLLLPVGYLVESAGVLQLKAWEEIGLRVHVDAGLPTYFQADWELAKQFWEHPELFGTIDSAKLFPRVFRVWRERFAMSGRQLLGADIRIDQIDDESFVENLAQFLYRHRHLPGIAASKRSAE
jgi:hypothetical protein